MDTEAGEAMDTDAGSAGEDAPLAQARPRDGSQLAVSEMAGHELMVALPRDA